jgi:hypothetical protein
MMPKEKQSYKRNQLTDRYPRPISSVFWLSAHPVYVYVLYDDDDYVYVFYSRDLCESMQPVNHMKKISIFFVMPCLCVALIHRKQEINQKSSYSLKTILISIGCDK